MSSILRKVLGLIFGILLLGCGQQKDYYTLFMENGCKPGETKLTADCNDAIRMYGNIDIDSFSGSYTSQYNLNELVRSIHVLLTAQISFPKSGKIFGLATLEEAQMCDFIDTFLSDRQANLNQLLVNYVLNAAPKITFGCGGISGGETIAYYSPWGIYICGADYAGLLQAVTPSILLHEARHQSVQHTVAWHGSLASDKGMDGAFGWEVVLNWGILQGIENLQNAQLSTDEIFFRCTIAEDTSLFSIVAVPPILAPAKAKDFNNPYIAKYCPDPLD